MMALVGDQLNEPYLYQQALKLEKLRAAANTDRVDGLLDFFRRISSERKPSVLDERDDNLKYPGNTDVYLADVLEAVINHSLPHARDDVATVVLNNMLCSMNGIEPIRIYGTS